MVASLHSMHSKFVVTAYLFLSMIYNVQLWNMYLIAVVYVLSMSKQSSHFYSPVSLRYCCKSAILVKTKPCRLANRLNSGSRAIPVGSSSEVISHKTPQGESPANRLRSTLASVCPSLAKTPPSFARSGKMWPGLAKSVATVLGLPNIWTVSDRSAALMPVVTPNKRCARTLVILSQDKSPKTTISFASTHPFPSRHRLKLKRPCPWGLHCWSPWLAA